MPESRAPTTDLSPGAEDAAMIGALLTACGQDAYSESGTGKFRTIRPGYVLSAPRSGMVEVRYKTAQSDEKIVQNVLRDIRTTLACGWHVLTRTAPNETTILVVLTGELPDAPITRPVGPSSPPVREAIPTYDAPTVARERTRQIDSARALLNRALSSPDVSGLTSDGIEQYQRLFRQRSALTPDELMYRAQSKPTFTPHSA